MDDEVDAEIIRPAMYAISALVLDFNGYTIDHGFRVRMVSTSLPTCHIQSDGGDENRALDNVLHVGFDILQ